MLQKLWNSIPQLSLTVIVLAIIKITLYYYNFDVPIKYFIGISELGLLIADDLLIYVPLFGILYFLFIESASQTSKTIKAKPGSSEGTVKSEKRSPGKIRKFFDAVIPWFMLSIFCGIMIGGPIYIVATSKRFSEALIGWSFVFMVVFFCIFIFRHERLASLIAPIDMATTLLIAAFLLMFIQSISHEITRVESGHFKGTKIITAENTYISTDSAFYIGQTSRYVFFYNSSQKSTIIIPLSDVKILELYSKK